MDCVGEGKIMLFIGLISDGAVMCALAGLRWHGEVHWLGELELDSIVQLING